MQQTSNTAGEPVTTDRQRIAEQTAKELAGMVYVVIKDCIEGYSTEHGIECSTRDKEAIEGTQSTLNGIFSRHILRALEQSEEWVSVCERKPPKIGQYPVCLEGMESAFSLDFWTGSLWLHRKPVTHWLEREIPRPPSPPNSEDVKNG